MLPVLYLEKSFFKKTNLCLSQMFSPMFCKFYSFRFCINYTKCFVVCFVFFFFCCARYISKFIFFCIWITNCSSIISLKIIFALKQKQFSGEARVLSVEKIKSSLLKNSCPYMYKLIPGSCILFASVFFFFTTTYFRDYCSLIVSMKIR